MTLKTQTKTTSRMKKAYINLVMFFVIVLLCRTFVFGGSDILSADGKMVLSVFLGTCYLWMIDDITLASLIGATFLVLSGTLTMNGAYNTTFGHYIIPLVLGCAAVTAILKETGVLRWFARWMLSRKIIHGRPYVYLCLMGLTGMLLACVANYISATLVIIPLIAEMRDYMGIDKKHSFNKATTLIVNWMIPVGTCVWPFGKSVPLTTLGLLQAAGYEVTMMEYFKVGIIFGVIALIVAMLGIKILIRPDTSCFSAYDVEVVQKELKENPISKRGKMGILVFALMMFMFVAPSLKFLGGVSTYISKMGTATIAILCTLIACFVSVDGEPLFDIGKSWNTLPWKTVIFLGGIFLFVGLISKEEYGIVPYFTALFAPLGNVLSPTMLMCVGIMLSMFLTNIGSNAVVAVLIWSAFNSVLIAMGVSDQVLIAFCVTETCMANVGILTPAGSTSVGLLLGSDKDVTLGEALPSNTVIMIVYALVGAVILFPLARLLV